TGKHGLQRLSNGDWNDGVVHSNVPPKKIGAIMKQGESVLNAAMATYALDIYARLLTYIGDSKLAEDAKGKAESQREAVRAQWTGKWFKRAWLSEELQWIGVDEMWLEPQPWAIIGAAATPEQEETLVQIMDQEVRQPSKIGAALLSKGFQKGLESPGMGTAGGVWPSINGTLIWALARVNGNLAWDEWKKNTLAVHAESYPDIWYGIWSGPDTYNSHLSKYPGQTIFVPPELKTKASLTGGVKLFWTDYPVSNMHPHAWPLYDIIKLIGLEFTEEGFILAPCLPKDEYDFSSPLIGLKKSKDGYSGFYAPSVAGVWKIEFMLNADEIKRFNHIEVNGKEAKLVREGQFIIFSGESAPDKPFQWSLK
ncbi:MAG: hypothetical protein LUQ65_09070, partial [Candidatus Helarchaeota archaeon]|nr:hypothetical protein [Candidatus Helarchaeota archaeon]